MVKLSHAKMHGLQKEYPYWTLFWNGKPYCSGCGGENIMEIEKPSGRWIMESETEKIIARLQTDIDMYRRSYQEMNVKYTSAVAEKTRCKIGLSHISKSR